MCSGIEAISVAWRGLPFEAQWFAEIAPFPSAVLAHRFPHVPNLGDFTRIDEKSGAIDLLVGGTPCQDFSVAGLRAGLDGERGNLTLEFVRLAQRTRPRWILWENVPGVLSIDDGRAFGAFLGGLGQLGYGFAYRVLDAQFFGVPQRRRRVFVVGCLGDWRRAAAVLFERESLSWNPPPCREARKDSATVATGGVANPLGAKHGGGWRGDLDNDTYVARCLTTREDSLDYESSNIISATVTSKWRKGSGGPSGSECGNLVCFSSKDHGADAGDVSPTLRAGGFAESHAKSGAPPAVAGTSGVRRLLPVECERLQGFPDSWTLVPYRGKPASDGPRYEAIGNSMAVPVVRWIGERIVIIETML